jgi:hypothetical protein
MKKVLLVASLAVISAASQAITFTFVNFGGDPAMYAGMSASSLVFSGNSMTVTPSNAAVGDPVAGSRSRRFSITYKIDAGAGKFITSMNGSFISAIAGANSSITMVESLVKLDAAGNEVGAAFATLTGSTNLSSQTFTGSVSFAPVRALIVKKDFFLVADTTQGFDLAALGTINQSVEVVPEPASMLALAGAAAMVARRRKIS